MTSYRAVLLDQDGTLINTFAPALVAYSAAVGRELTHEQLLPVAHLGAARNLISALLGHTACDADDDRYHEVFDAGVRQIQPYPGIVDLLAALRADGLRTGVVTNSDMRSARIVLGAQRFDDLLDTVVTADMVGAPKPDPASIRMALENLAVTPEEAIFVGDSDADMRAARAAGVFAVAAGWGVLADGIAAADAWCDQPADVLAVLAGRGKSA